MQPRINRALRSSFEFAAGRVARSDRLMSIVYDVVNGEQFSALGHHEEMLSDAVRVDAYHRGIHRNVQVGDVVVDLGTGTGLLAFMASRAGAAKVYAIDHSDVIDVAEELARDNGFTNIEFVRENSRDFTPPEPVDVIVHEQLSDELFGENMVDNLIDLRDRILRKQGRILPGRFRLFVEPIALRDEHRVARIWDVSLPDQLDFSSLRTSPIAAQHLPARPDQAYLSSGAVQATIGVPSALLEFDLATIGSASELQLEHHVERVATSEAVIDGFCIWFEAVFDDETTLTTSPLAPRTHWGTRLIRADARECRPGEVLSYQVSMGQLIDASTWTANFN